MTSLVYDGLYAMTMSGKLLHITTNESGVAPPKVLHGNIKFLPNRHGRYFINTASHNACMKTDKREIYCEEISALQPGPKIGELTNFNQPLLSIVETSPFDVDEVAFGGRHFCFLSTDGEVWCKGDNGCGQIT